MQSNGEEAGPDLASDSGTQIEESGGQEENDEVESVSNIAKSAERERDQSGSMVNFWYYLLICRLALSKLAMFSFKRYFLVPMQKAGTYLDHSNVVMSKLKVFLSSSDIRESRVS